MAWYLVKYKDNFTFTFTHHVKKCFIDPTEIYRPIYEKASTFRKMSSPFANFTNLEGVILE